MGFLGGGGWWGGSVFYVRVYVFKPTAASEWSLADGFREESREIKGQ